MCGVGGGWWRWGTEVLGQGACPPTGLNLFLYLNVTCAIHESF